MYNWLCLHVERLETVIWFNFYKRGFVCATGDLESTTLTIFFVAAPFSDISFPMPGNKKNNVKQNQINVSDGNNLYFSFHRSSITLNILVLTIFNEIYN